MAELCLSVLRKVKLASSVIGCRAEEISKQNPEGGLWECSLLLTVKRE